MKRKWAIPAIVAGGVMIIALLFFSATESKKASGNILDEFRKTDDELTKMSDSLKAIDSLKLKDGRIKQPE